MVSTLVKRTDQRVYSFGKSWIAIAGYRAQLHATRPIVANTARIETLVRYSPSRCDTTVVTPSRMVTP